MIIAKLTRAFIIERDLYNARPANIVREMLNAAEAELRSAAKAHPADLARDVMAIQKRLRHEEALTVLLVVLGAFGALIAAGAVYLIRGGF